jgi:NADH-quinone oxidoreductase subunit J
VRVNPRDRVRLVKMDAVRPAQPTPVPPQEPSS